MIFRPDDPFLKSLIIEINFLNSSFSNSNFFKLKLSQNTVDYLNLWYYSKRKISIDRLEIMIFQEFLFLWIDYLTWKVSKVGCVFPMVISSEFPMCKYIDDDHRGDASHFIRNYLPPQYLAASKIFIWNFIF